MGASLIDLSDEIKAMFHFSIEKTAELITDQIGMVRLEGYGVRVRATCDYLF